MMKYVIATAGHVDHGKSALVKVLTGIDPDRLMEEQQRQMTIDLGFAWFTLPSEDEVGIVDVPGHRDFINNMLAGVGSIDAVMLVVAADEGIMPQTLEHMMILDLLEIKRGLIVITKTDLVREPAWLEMVENDIRDAVRGTVLQDFPLVQVSAVTRDGIQGLVGCIQTTLSQSSYAEKHGDAHLAVDRVFSIKGFGTVVTGTLRGGFLKTGEEIEILPVGKISRIRNIETHKQKLTIAEPGSRVALNLTGVDVQEIDRGSVVVRPKSVKPSMRLDAQVRIIASSSRGLKHNDQVKLYHGTSEILARVRTLGLDVIQRGETGFVQLELSAPLVCWKGDHFIIRRPSPQETIGGGQIINPAPDRRYKRYAERTLTNLNAQRVGSVWDIFALLLEGKFLVSEAKLEDIFLKEGLVYQDEVEMLRSHAEFVEFSTICSQKNMLRFVTTRQKLYDLSKVINSALYDTYQRSAIAPGLLISELSKKFGMQDCVLQSLLEKELLDEDLAFAKRYVFLKGRAIQFPDKDLHKIERLNSIIEREPYAPPSLEEIQDIVGNELLQALLFTGELVQVEDSIAFRENEFNAMKAQLIRFLERHGEISLAQYRDLLHTSRKYALAFLEYMDRSGVTERVGEVRKLKTSG